MSLITTSVSQQLDSIRGFSAFVVLLGHTNQTLLLPTTNWGASYIGLLTQLSVMIFFVLSGFLIGKSIISNKNKNGTFLIDKYAEDRALRIYPPLIISTILVWILFYVAPYFFPSGTIKFIEMPGVRFVRSSFSASMEQTIGSLFFINGFKISTPSSNGPLWSLAFEIWYYIIAALIFSFKSNKFLTVLVLVLVVFVTKSNTLLYMLAPVWFSGLLIAVFHKKILRINSNLMLSVSLFFFASSIFFAGRAIKLPADSFYLFDPWTQYKVISGLWFGTILILVLSGRIKLPTIFKSFSSFSYTLYIIHFPIMLFVFGCFQNYIIGNIRDSIIVAILTVMTTIAISLFISKLSENKKAIDSVLQSFTMLRLPKFMTRS